MGRLTVFYFFLLIGIFSCVDTKLDAIRKIIEDTREVYAPDKRTAIFEIAFIPESPVIVTGETNIPQAKSELLKNLAAAGIEVDDRIALLPDSALEDQTHAIVNVSVSNLRSQPRHSAELVTQALLGTPVNVLKEEDGWYLIQTPDHYIAWTNSGSLISMNQQEFLVWKSADKVIYLPTYGSSFNQDGDKVSDLVFGNVLVIESENTELWEIRYPDGRIAIINKNEAMEVQDWEDHITISDPSIIASCRDLMGIPYLWGGTSTKGVDCSGFTKTIYLRHGLILPRDASQQVFIGELIDQERDFSKLEVGDLLFFGRKETDGSEKVVHVGIWIGNNRFIHASGDVHISSMDSLSDIFDSYNYARYLRTKRIFGTEDQLPASFLEIYQSM